MNTERLHLRMWQSADIDHLDKLNSDPKVMEYFPGILSRAQSSKMLEKMIADFQKNKFGLWLIEEKHSKKFCGFAGLKIADFSASFTPAVEIVWRLLPEFWGRGYAVEAAKAVLLREKTRTDLNEVVSFTAAVNQKSIRVMQKLEMKYEQEFDHPLVEPASKLSRHVLYRKNFNEFLFNTSKKCRRTTMKHIEKTDFRSLQKKLRFLSRFIVFFLASASLNLYAADGKLTLVIGEVVIENSTEKIQAKSGMLVKQGEFVKTSNKGRAALALTDGTSVMIDSGSIFQLGEESKHYVKTGTSSLIFKSLVRGEKTKWEVRTPVYTAGVRGTGFTLQVKKKSTRLVLYEGKVIVSDFIQESGFSRDSEEFLQDFISDMEINAGTALEFDGESVSEKKVSLQKESTYSLHSEHLKNDTQWRSSLSKDWYEQAKKIRESK